MTDVNEISETPRRSSRLQDKMAAEKPHPKPGANMAGENSKVQCDICQTWLPCNLIESSGDVENSSRKCSACIASESVEDYKVLSPKSQKRKLLMLQMLEEEKILREKRDAEYLTKRFQLLMGESELGENILEEFPVGKMTSSAHHQPTKCQPTVNVTQDQIAAQPIICQPLSNVRAITNEQIAARQSCGKDLPVFTGNPEEWPVFVYTYKATTEICGYNDVENLLRLQKALRGKALDLVRSRLLLPSNISDIIKTLEMIYGRPEIIIRSLIDKVRCEPPPRMDKLDTIVSYALAVQNMCSTMEASASINHLANPMLLQEIVDKLPSQLKLQWATYKKTISADVDISHISKWLFDLAGDITDVVPVFNDRETKSRQPLAKAHINSHVEQNNHGRQFNCKICTKECTNPSKCSMFVNMSLNDKWTAIKRLRLCRTCLAYHGERRCRVDKLCGVNGCTFRHNALLHNNANSNSNILTTMRSCNAHGTTQQSILFRIVPVTVYAENKEVNTYAFLDEGSSVTLIDNALVRELGVSGPNESLCLKWTGDTHRLEKDSQVVSVAVSGNNANKKFLMKNVRSVKALCLPEQSLDADKLQMKFKHLRGLPLSSYDRAVPQILIGLDNKCLGFPMKTREGGPQEPAATKTRLGWIVYGQNGYQHSARPQQHHSFHVCECSAANNSLNDLMREYFSIDGQGVKAPIQLKSQDEQRACNLLEQGVVRRGERFETPLLWRYDDVELPDSWPMAKRRFEHFQRKMTNNPQLASHMKTLMSDYISKGYIRKLTQDELRMNIERIWYLPIFTVINPNKPNKVRVVWDAAAQVNGISLNSLLLKGPDQLNPLLHVMFRFRERRVAICGDIREMFHQILVRSEDQHVQRFLWSDSNESEPDVYVMQVLTFGATCSPSCAQFIMTKNAREFEREYPRAVECIVKNHYVDDLLDSVDTEAEAIKLAQDVKKIHAKAGFDIRNWNSNSTKVLAALGSDSQSNKNLNVESQIQSTERVLGMWWCTSSDSFTYVLSSKPSLQELLSGSTRPTKRQVLRIMMSTFDPLGLIANFTIYVKILMQKIWRFGLEWDDLITDEQYNEWQLWISQMKNIINVSVPRCYFKELRIDECDKLELHIFVDASENAFSAVAYIRASKGAEVECSIIASKARVAPLKIMSIPRLELEAAKLGARLAKTIKEAHSISFGEQYFWSDSKTVLSWIKSDHRRYRQFVAFRVSEILELSNLNQWRYVPTKLNVADDATKWAHLPDCSISSRWFGGPEFLKLPKEMWPKDITNPAPTTEELRAYILHASIIKPHIVQVGRFSSWRRLIRTVVFVFRFIWNLSARKRSEARKTEYVSKEEYIQAENYLYRLAQIDSFKEEISIMEHNRNVLDAEKQSLEKSSVLFKLSPYLDDGGIIRCRGRIDAAKGVTCRIKRPIVLPKDHHVTRLVVRSYHHRFHHQHDETVVNEIRQKFIIPRLRILLKTEKRNCYTCKIFRAIPNAPEMAELPEARLSTFTRPFSYVGIDYFGPMMVAFGRRTEKRWGVLITCLTTRAIHIEVAHSLSADSCILAIKRFIARRGVPIEIRCDNGTNFHGAEREIRQEIKKNNMQLAEEFSSSTTKWVFNPPAAPHMGGSWERLVRSVKRTLDQTLPSRHPSDELLHSMLLEAERTINTRPLTYLPLDDVTSEAITPNHFLVGSSNGEKPDGIMTNSEAILKQNWLKSQQFANSFWRRWIREYLPTLTRRTKWFQRVKPIQVDDIVIVVDESSPRNTWPKGRILSVTPGKDGQVRKAIVQTASGVYERPAVKLAVLDVNRGKSDDAPDVPRGSVGNAGHAAI